MFFATWPDRQRHVKSSGGFRIRVIVDLVKMVPFGAICTSHYLLKLNYYISGFFINDFSC